MHRPLTTGYRTAWLNKQWRLIPTNIIPYTISQAIVVPMAAPALKPFLYGRRRQRRDHAVQQWLKCREGDR